MRTRTCTTARTDVARRRRGRAVSGILVLDKPSGLTSNAALQRAKRLFGAAKAGHTGSLDPLATGVLPLCFGEATKFSQYLLDADKAYDATFVLGERRDTGDADGELVDACDASGIEQAQVEAALEPLRGEIMQLPPMYSALKQQGTPLYKLARAGQEVERQPRRVCIRQFELLALRPGRRCEADVRVACTKGTYVRSLAEDLGAALGVGGYVSALRRTAVGPFSLDAAVSLATLEALAAESSAQERLDALLHPVVDALGHLPLVTLPESSGFYLRQGQPVLVRNAPCDGMVRVALETGAFLGLGEILDDGRVAPRRLIATGR
jgi:tRNA pseudouridine55 synthase